MKRSTVLVLLLIAEIFAWNGEDLDSGNNVEIEERNLVEEGEEIEYYDCSEGYGTLSVDSIEDTGDSVEIKGTDEYGETRIFEMEK